MKYFLKIIKKTAFTLLLLNGLGLGMAFSQSSTDLSEQLTKIGSSDLFLWGVIALEGALILLSLLLLFAVLKIRLLLFAKYEPEVETAAEAADSYWSKLMRKLSDTKPLSMEKDIILDHDYDGINELDNNLPPWWKAMYNTTIVIGILYLLYFHVFDYGKSAAEEYQIEVAQAELEIQEYMAQKANLIDENNVALVTEELLLEEGKEIFLQNCAACHGRAGEGGVGPNMTDNYWIHGNELKDIFKTIKYGVQEKGMISWKTKLSPAQMQEVASYIVTLGGTNPANAKEPEGEFYPGEGEEEVEGQNEAESSAATVEKNGDEIGMLDTD